MAAEILLITAALFFTTPAGDIEHALLSDHVVQEWATDRRQACLDDCRQWIEGYVKKGRRGGSSRFQARMYARCVARCERQFWKEWDREMKELGPD
ncbi:MAG: hypothetical protein RDU20_09750 [Desulfomonilaceae bacterium]|nr:hypothetical protein [Desulfomonilaceae bacterium]